MGWANNICFVENRVVLIDWPLVCQGNGTLGIGGWLPSLAAEGGPKPETILPDAGDVATIISGFFAAEAGLTPPLEAPNIRQIQRLHLKMTLLWLIQALNLPPLDRELAELTHKGAIHRD